MEQIKITSNEKIILMLLAEHYVLTVNQVAYLSGTRLRSVQKRIGSLYDKGLLRIAPRNFGETKGRPENVSMLNSRGFNDCISELLLHHCDQATLLQYKLRHLLYKSTDETMSECVDVNFLIELGLSYSFLKTFTNIIIVDFGEEE